MADVALPCQNQLILFRVSEHGALLCVSQLEVKKNKEQLAKLKTENKDLRSELSKLMSDQVSIVRDDWSSIVVCSLHFQPKR
jgi:hypothetical protein